MSKLLLNVNLKLIFYCNLIIYIKIYIIHLNVFQSRRICAIFIRNINYNEGSYNFSGLYHVQCCHVVSEMYLIEQSSQVKQGNVTTNCVSVDAEEYKCVSCP
jgi:hypothetical protein